MSTVPTVTLNNGVTIPQLGFGVFQVPDDETTAAVTAALEAGYRSIDTAAVYGNETGVGRALAESGLGREELFVTTKLWNADQGYDATHRLRREPGQARPGPRGPLPHPLAHPGPRPLHRHLAGPGEAAGRGPDPSRRRLQLPARAPAPAAGGELPRPAVNQIELHPGLQQRELRSLHAGSGIATEAWSPLAQGALLDDEVLTSLAGRHGRSPAQVVLRWHLQLGNVVIPKSVTPARIRQNIDVFDFELSADDMEAIAGLDRGMRTGPDPDTLN